MTIFNGEPAQDGESVGIEKIILLPLHLDSDWEYVSETDVMLVAKEWSIDPTSLEHQGFEGKPHPCWHPPIS